MTSHQVLMNMMGEDRRYIQSTISYNKHYYSGDCPYSSNKACLQCHCASQYLQWVQPEECLNKMY